MASIFKPTFTKLADGRRVKRKTRKWYVKYRDVDGRWIRRPGYPSKETTKRLADTLEREVEMQRAGLVDPFAVHRRRPLSEHVSDYRAYLEAKDDTAEHVERTISRIETVMEGCGMSLSADMTAVKAG